MSLTPNLGLYTEDDPSTNFKDWREGVNGTARSNALILDEAVAAKSDKSKPVYGTLLASAWTGVQAPFTQVIDVEGLGASQNGDISVAQSATFEQRQAAREAMLALAGQTDGHLTVVADGELPEIDIPIVVILLG